jgi:hypothetical protein
MPVTALLAAMVSIPEVDSAAAIKQIWTLAESAGDVDVMQAIAERPSALPPEIVERLRLRKEAPVRVAYLSRPDLSEEERSSLLATEKRSDVFAGLIAAAKENESLAARLFEQFKLRPTKVLARQFLRDDLGDASLRFECLKVLVDERRPPEWLSRKFKQIIVENVQDKTRTSLLANMLPVELLVHLDVTHLEPAAQVTVLERMAARAAQVGPKPVWEERSLLNEISRFFAAAATAASLSDEAVRTLDEFSASEWLYEGDQIAGALAGRRALLDDTVDEKRLRARIATGSALEDLVHLAVVVDGPGNEPFLQGLLENPAAWEHKRFDEIIRRTNPALIVRAVQATRSHELISKLWELGGNRSVPDACWDLLPDALSLRDRLLRETLVFAANAPMYVVETAVQSLVSLGVSDDAVGSIPYEMFVSRIYRHYYAALLHATAAQVLRLQLRELGEDAHYWENFNNLSQGWSGTLLELLEASRRL